MAETTETQEIVKLSAAGKQVYVTRIGLDGAPFTIDGGGNVVDLSQYLANPQRIKAQRTFTSIDSLVAYIAKFRGVSTALFAQQASDTIVAELDSHASGLPSHNSHRATLKLEKTIAMKAWIANNGKRMSQVQFAEFIEDNASDVNDPKPNVMIEIAKSMQAQRNGKFESKVDLDNGSFVFSNTEEVRGTFKNGRIEVPKTFQIGLVAYKGQKDGFKIDARLRFLIDDGVLTMWYVLPQLDRVLDNAFAEVVGQVAKDTKIDVLHGS